MRMTPAPSMPAPIAIGAPTPLPVAASAGPIASIDDAGSGVAPPHDAGGTQPSPGS
jgi:hypothetical protein